MKDLYKHLKGTKPKIEIKDFKESIFDLCHKYLKSGLNPKVAEKVARLRAYIEINFKDL